MGIAAEAIGSIRPSQYLPEPSGPSPEDGQVFLAVGGPRVGIASQFLSLRPGIATQREILPGVIGCALVVTPQKILFQWQFDPELHREEPEFLLGDELGREGE